MRKRPTAKEQKGPNPTSTRAQRLLALGKQKHDEENRNPDLSDNEQPESPCPAVTPSNIDFLNFSTQLVKGTPSSHRTPIQPTKRTIPPIRRFALATINENVDDSDLRSPPKKVSNNDKENNENKSTGARRSLNYESASNSTGLGMLAAAYDSDDNSRSCQEFPEKGDNESVSSLLNSEVSYVDTNLKNDQKSVETISYTDLSPVPFEVNNNLQKNCYTELCPVPFDVNNNGPDISYTELRPVPLEVDYHFDTESNNVQTSSESTAQVQLQPDPTITLTENESVDLFSDVLQHDGVEATNAIVIPLDSVRGVEVEVTSEEDQVDIPEEVTIPIQTVEIPVPDSEPVTPTVNDEDQYPKPRSCEPRRWKQNAVKKLKEAGQSHVSLRGKVREAKTMSDGCDETCKRNCHFNFSNDDRLTIFNEFYSIQSHTMKWYFIVNLIKSEEVKRRTVQVPINGSAKKNCSNSYFLPLRGTDKQVCKKFFLQTLATSEKTVRTALDKKKANNGSIPLDARGKKKKSTEVSKIIKQDVMNHIKQYHTIESHYTRKSSKARYLPEFLNCRKMHSQYVIQREGEGVTQNVATLRQYRSVFKKEFNLKFFRPKKDQCAKCLSWKNRTPGERTEEALRKYEKHISDKRIGQDLKTQDIDFVKKTPNEGSLCVATCDLEKVFLCPKGENSEFYYKSKLSLYNFTIFVSGEQKGICYVWDQTEARRGSAEISSCLWSFLKMKTEQGVREFRLYSDNCSAQNKNQILFSMYIMACIRLNIRIVHRYLETGHTHMEVDSVHAAIQNSIKQKEIFVPSEWYAAIKLAKKTLPKYEVIELKQDQIFNFANLAAHQTWDKIKTSEFKEVVFDSTEPGIIAYKTQYEEDVKRVQVIKRKQGHPVNWKSIALQKMYKARIPLRPIEIRDLKSLCQSGAIPSRYHSFYLNIINNTAENIQPPPPHDLSDQESSDANSSDSDSGESD